MLPEVAIVGAGPAGLTAAIYAARARLEVEVFEKGFIGGQVATATHVENYPGFPEGVEGIELIERMKKQAEKFGAKIRFAEVKSIDWDRRLLMTSQGETNAEALIIASGASPRELGVKGEREFKGKGVSYCAVCDGAFYTDEKVAVVGGGNTAVEEALYLTKFTSKVYLIHRRDALRAERILQERLFSNPKVEILWNSIVREIVGENFVKGMLIENVLTGETKNIEVAGVFVYIGLKPNTGFLNGVVELDHDGFIITNDEMETSVEGIFAAGDVRSKGLRQIATAVGDGAIAAVAVERYLRQQKHIEEEINKDGRKIVLVYDPLDELNRRLHMEAVDKEVIVLDRYKYPKLVSKWGIKDFPAVLVFEKGRLTFKREGFSDWKEVREIWQ